MFGTIIKTIAIALFTSSAIAHELTPTYAELKPSYVDNILVTTMKMWNRRNDVEYYEINVYDKEWNKVPFAAVDRIFQISYLQHKQMDVYFREKDAKRIEWICTTSKQLKQDVISTGVKSQICSKIAR
tara:strand:+ start:141 stop:524 length:384 start_codon:yes stop_codon:yes gene_type:complete